MNTNAKEQVETILKDAAVSYDIQYDGKATLDKWDCLKWRVLIGDQAFDFHTGMAWEESRPHIADVLYCLIGDMESLDVDFYEWCDNCGFNNDSIKDLGIYNACIENGRKLHRVFHPEDVDRLKEVLEDY